MKDKLKKVFSLTTYIIINLIYILVGAILVKYKIINQLYYSYGYILFAIINIILFIILLVRRKYKRNIIDIFLLLIIIFGIISTIFTHSTNTALFGTYGRNEGLFAICYYISLLFISGFVKKEDRKLIIYSILVLGIIHCIYGFCQAFDLFNVKVSYHKGAKFINGFTTNPNFFATLMLICITYAIGLYTIAKDTEEQIIYLVLIFLFYTGMLLSNTLSVFVGLYGIMILLLIYCIKHKYIKKYIILVSILLTTTLFIHFVGLTTIVSDLLKTKDETVEISKGNIDGNYGTGRIEVWKTTIKVIPKYLLHGVGIDNFIHINNGGPIVRKGAMYDKAHNEYLQILATMGIFSLLSYIALHFLIIKKSWKYMKNKEIYLLLPIISYLIQAQFNISVIEVAPIFYIGLGLCINRK